MKSLFYSNRSKIGESYFFGNNEGDDDDAKYEDFRPVKLDEIDEFSELFDSDI